MNLQICNHCRHSVVTPVYFWRLLEDKFYYCHGCCWDRPSHFSTFGICKRFSFGKFSSDTQTLYHLKSHKLCDIMRHPRRKLKTFRSHQPKNKVYLLRLTANIHFHIDDPIYWNFVLSLPFFRN